jgi:hypothetical protein
MNCSVCELVTAALLWTEAKTFQQKSRINIKEKPWHIHTVPERQVSAGWSQEAAHACNTCRSVLAWRLFYTVYFSKSVINGRWMTNNEMKRIWKELVCGLSRYHPGNCFSWNNQCPWQDSNQASLEYKSRVSPLDQHVQSKDVLIQLLQEWTDQKNIFYPDDGVILKSQAPYSRRQ